MIKFLKSLFASAVKVETPVVEAKPAPAVVTDTPVKKTTTVKKATSKPAPVKKTTKKTASK